MQRPLRWYDFIAINAYWLGIHLTTGIITPLLLPYLVVQFMPPEYKNTYLANLRVVGLSVAMLVQPLAGLLSDQARTRFGRRRPFIAASMALNALFLVVIGLSPRFTGSPLDEALLTGFGVTAAYAVLMAGIVLLQFSSNIGHGALQGLIPDVVPPNQRGRASGVKAVLELLPTLLILGLAVGRLIDTGQIDLVVAIMITGLVVTGLVTLLGVKERSTSSKSTSSKSTGSQSTSDEGREAIRHSGDQGIREEKIKREGLAEYGVEPGWPVGGGAADGGALDGEPVEGATEAGKAAAVLAKAPVERSVAATSTAAETASPSAPSAGGAFWRAFPRLLGLTVLFVGATRVALWLVQRAAEFANGPGVSLEDKMALVGLAGLLAMAGSILVGVYFGAWVGIGKDAPRRKGFIWWVINRLLFLAAVGSIQGFAQFFLADVLRIPDAAAMTTRLLAAVAVFLIPSALLGGWLADRVGQRRLVGLAGIVAMLGTLLLIFAPSVTMVMVSGAILGLATGAFMATNWALGTQLVPPADAGRYLGISNLAGAGAGIVGAGIGGPIADFFNGLQPGLGYLVLFAIYAGLFGLSVAVLGKVKV